MHRMANESRRSQMLRGVLDLCLLAVLDEGPAYGYEMTKRLRDRGLASVGEGSIYPLLGRLEREGLVETYRAASNGGPQRKYYRPSRAGRLALALGVSGMASRSRRRRCGARPGEDRGGLMSDFVDQCRREWKRLGVPDPVAEEMAADLASDIREAEADGISIEELLGSSASDPRAFAASWAGERGIVQLRPVRSSEWRSSGTASS